MKKLSKVILSCLLLILSFLLITSCNHEKKDIISTNEQVEFTGFLDEVFSDIVTSDTLTLNYTLLDPTLYHINSPSPTLGDFSITAMKNSYIKENEYLNRLSNFDYTQLTPQQQICYDIIKNNFQLDCQYQDYILYSEVLGPTTGIQAQLPILLAEYNINSKKDIEDYLALLSDMPRYFSQIAEFEAIKSKAGLFMSDNVANEIIEQCNSFIASPESNYLIQCFDDKLKNLNFLTDKDRQTYSHTNYTYVTTYVITAYKELITSLETLKGSGTNNGGLANYKNGKAYYEYLVQSSTGSSRPIMELASMLDDTLNDSLIDMTTYLKTDKDLVDKLNNYKFVETEPEKILTYLKENIQSDFPSLPNVGCTIKYVHESLQDYISPAMYLIPQLDNYQNNCIYINANPNYDLSELFTTIAHEGYPGHLYQNVYFRSKDIHPIRNVVSCLGYEEGWATYAEQYSYCLAGLDSSVAAVLRDNMIATHCIYSRADIGIHYENWSYNETIDYLTKYVSPESSDIIYSTLLEEPGIYLPYSVGYIEINELLCHAQNLQKDKFDLKDFHTFLLDIGPADFDTIHKNFDLWLSR